MENPLSAREFLKRFHLPQLVRISSLDDSLQGQDSTRLTLVDEPQKNLNKKQQQTAPTSPAGHSNTSISSSFVAVSNCQAKATHEASDWTYSKAPQQLAHNNQFGRESDEENDRTSIVDNESSLRFGSISAWSSVQVDRMLELQHRAQQTAGLICGPVRVPRASLVQAHTCNSVNYNDGTIRNSESSRETTESENQHRRKNSEFKGEVRVRRGLGLQDNNEKNSNISKRDEKNFEENIRLTPPSKRPTLSKLHLNQPFLLYKAYRKLELCAYLIDPKNELNEKSGDPIYFPHNYPGWFSLRPPNNAGRCKPFETIDEVCRTNAQIFLSRDELVAYELPSKLSHLTKLKNNQLLALPLAINLDRKSGESKHHDNQQSISDIKQMVIQCGQVLKICGVYEDVLPLIKGKQQQQKKSSPSESKSNRVNRTQAKKHQSSDKQQTNCKIHDQTQSSISKHKMAQPEALYQRPHERNRKSLHGNYDQVKYAPGCQHYQRYIDINHQSRVQLETGGSNAPQAKQPVGQRYARCILLSPRTVDQLTNLSVENLNRSENGEQRNDDLQDKEEETEVLIPIDQRGRFYLCATNQSLRNEFQFYLSSAIQSTNIVMKLSQIIHLLGLSRRLRMGSAPSQLMAEWNHRDQRAKAQFASHRGFQLPLTVHLVFGPRPATYSPTMLGASSTMESYFRSEPNIAGHLITCAFNFNQTTLSSPNKACLDESATFGSACSCYQRLLEPEKGSSNRFGVFSAVLCIERMSKRDVLLACTIKKEPLSHIDLFNDDNGNPNSSGKKSSRIHETASKTNSGDWQQINRLAALREVTFEQKSDHFKTTAASKSSFSRLRACRSLISLNGRRKKQRPNIPSCMLAAPSGSQQIDSLSSGSFDGISPGGGIGFSSLAIDMSSSSSQHNNSSHNQITGNQLVVMVEFDCNDEELQFVRTFVENSIPTSNIPDLVLSRMEFCQRNSSYWEQQLKLSYKSLSTDFDSCQVQMEQNRRKLKLYANLPSAQSHQHQSQPVVRSQAPREHAATVIGQRLSATNSVHSTASSRSSSGVSSAGAEQRQQLASSNLQVSEPTGATLSSASAISSQHTNNDNKEEHQPTSRLLRLVHRILPKSAVAVAVLNSSSTARGEHQQRLPAQVTNNRCELSPEGRNASSSSSSSSSSISAATGNDAANTLMNAQKVHRRMTDSQGRHLAIGDNRPLGERKHQLVNGCQQNKDKESAQSGNESASSSHLYESLERLNEARLMKDAAAKRRSTAVADDGRGATKATSWFQQQMQHRQRAQRQAKDNKRLPAIGRSIEYLIGGKLRVVGRGWQVATASASATGVQVVDKNASISATTESDSEENSEDYDDWWQSGADGNTRESTGERFCVSLGGDKYNRKLAAAAAAADKRKSQQTAATVAAEARSWKHIDQEQKLKLGRNQAHLQAAGFDIPLRRGRRLRGNKQHFDVGAMEPVSIEHDEFVSMVCHEESPKHQGNSRSQTDGSCSRDSSRNSTLDGCSSSHLSKVALEDNKSHQGTNKAHCVVASSTSIGNGQQQQQQQHHCDSNESVGGKEIIYANLAIDGKHLLEENGNGVSGVRHLGRMERKLMKMRGKRDQSPQPNSRRPLRPISLCHEIAWHSEHHLAGQDHLSYLEDNDDDDSWVREGTNSKHRLSSAWSSSLCSSSAESSENFRSKCDDSQHHKNCGTGKTGALSIGSSSSSGGVQSASNTTVSSTSLHGLVDWPREKHASSGQRGRRRRPQTLAVVGQVTSGVRVASATNSSSPDVRWIEA